MKKNNSPEPVKMTISYELPDGHSELKLGKDEFGSLKILDENGNEVKPLKSTRSTYYDRATKPKYQTVFHHDNNYTTIGGLKELAELQSFFVIDTNTDFIANKRVSISFLMRLKLVVVDGGYKAIPVDKNVFIFEFIGVPKEENPEMLAILKLANDILAEESDSHNSPIWLINDSDLGNHLDFSTQKSPIYGTQFLPNPFRISYASSDTGAEAINQLFKIADGKAKDYFKRIKNGSFGGNHLIPLKEDNRVLFTCHPLPIEKFESCIIKESTAILGEIRYS
ncbi:MAG: hypothetical protein B7Y48_05425 [Methylophilales bacterium 28-44-11]|jgi:hypothetical protein|nr:MAG: hypothetical protein B7Y48_05425 [Methylophilales bacterium 28-44-11]OYY84261.1 MAG: hypothetical protein B7Y34_00825 [Methylophilales bacterium 16-45-9]